MKKYFLISIIFAFISCEKKTELELSNPLVLKDGILYQDSTSTMPYTGRHKSKMLNMKIEYEVTNGIKNGEFIVYHPNDKVQMVGKINDNKNEGVWKYYYQNGSLESEGSFNNDTVDGFWKWYDPKGIMIQEGFFIMGLKEGDWKKYDSFGQVKAFYTYNNDEIIDSIIISE